MSLDRKILEELKRFNQINSYILNEQPAPPAPVDPAAAPGSEEAPIGEPEGGMAPPAEGGEVAPVDATAETPPAEGDAIPEPVDVENDPDVEEVGNEPEGEEGESEEIDITDLVTTQQEIQAKQDEFMDGIFSKLDDLETKLSHMDEIMDKINGLEAKFDKYREKTPEEKLMLRSLDSYPYNQKLTDFFDDKKDEMEETGKNEYVLTSDDVENFSPNEVKKTFNIYDENDNAL